MSTVYGLGKSYDKNNQFLFQTWEPTAQWENYSDYEPGTTRFVPRQDDRGTDSFAPRPTGHVEVVTLGTWHCNGVSADGPLMAQKAEVIKRLGADVLALQGLSSFQDLEEFQARYLGENRYPYLFLFQTDPFNNVGALSRFPMTEVLTYQSYGASLVPELPNGFAHPPLKATFTLDHWREFSLLVTQPAEKKPRRDAEMQAVRHLFDDGLRQESKRLLAVAGGGFGLLVAEALKGCAVPDSLLVMHTNATPPNHAPVRRSFKFSQN